MMPILKIIQNIIIGNLNTLLNKKIYLEIIIKNLDYLIKLNNL